MHAGWPRKAVGDTWTPMVLVNAASSLVDLWMAVTPPKDLYLNTPCNNNALLCDVCLHKRQLLC